MRRPSTRLASCRTILRWAARWISHGRGLSGSSTSQKQKCTGNRNRQLHKTIPHRESKSQLKHPKILKKRQKFNQINLGPPLNDNLVSIVQKLLRNTAAGRPSKQFKYNKLPVDFFAQRQFLKELGRRSPSLASPSSSSSSLQSRDAEIADGKTEKSLVEMTLNLKTLPDAQAQAHGGFVQPHKLKLKNLKREELPVLPVPSPNWLALQKVSVVEYEYISV